MISYLVIRTLPPGYWEWELVYFADEDCGWRLRISATPSRVKMWWLPLTRSVNPSRKRRERSSLKRMFAPEDPASTRNRTGLAKLDYAKECDSG